MARCSTIQMKCTVLEGEIKSRVDAAQKVVMMM